MRTVYSEWYFCGINAGRVANNLNATYVGRVRPRVKSLKFVEVITVKLKKWSYKDRKYHPYEVPNTWNVKNYSSDMDEIVNCAECGKEMKYGEGFCSRLIHSDMGFGYTVCTECYFEESLLENLKDN